jgi:methyl-accepting chemotaxis protein
VRFRAKLMAAFGSVAVITLGVSLLGLWQANRLGSALYEVGVVRLPSIVALNEIWKAKADLDASTRVLATPGLNDSTFATELDREVGAWRRAERGWAAYEPLPQTDEESAIWKEFVPAWKNWKATYDSVVAAARPAARTTASDLRATEQQQLAAIAKRSAEVDGLLARLNAVNVQVATEANQSSVAGYHDLDVVRLVMLLAALLSVVGAVAGGFTLGGRLSRPLSRVSESLSRIERGDLTTWWSGCARPRQSEVRRARPTGDPRRNTRSSSCPPPSGSR